MARSGLSGWAKKNQCHHAVAKRTSQRFTASRYRNAVQDGEVGDSGGLIHGGAERGVVSAIMTYEREAVEAQLARASPRSPGPLARLDEADMIGSVRRLRGLAEAAQIGTADRVCLR